VDQKDSEVEEYAPTAPVPKEKKEKDQEASELKEVANDVERVINKIDDKLKSKEMPNVSSAMDRLTQKAQNSISSIEEILKKGEWSIKSALYKSNRLFNPNILYGSVMQSAIKNMLKWELQVD
jgi:methanogenic corrinoid protein MtbC1